MKTSNYDDLIQQLSKFHLDKTIESEHVVQGLSSFIDTFAFDAVLIYERTESDDFVLCEHIIDPSKPLCKEFSLSEISKPFYEQLAHNPMVLVQESETCSEDEVSLFNIFDAATIVITSTVDNEYSIYGMIVCLNFQTKPMEQETLDQLPLPLAMISKYIAMRCFQIKLTCAKLALERVLDNTGIDIYVNDFYTHDILYANESMMRPYGGEKAFTGRKCWEVLFPGQKGQCEFCPQKYIVDECGNPTKVYTWDYQRAFDGSWFRVFSAAFRWSDGRLAHVVSSADITDNKRNEELIQYMANYDSLTDLPNRRKLIADCEERIARKDDSSGYVLFFDIDKFKQINDQFGHDCGDEFLVALGNFFRNIPMLKDSIYRNGGDEFVALLDGEFVVEDILHMASFIHNRFNRPWHLKKGDAFCNVSIGIATYPEDGQDAEVLINKADQAMYKVKGDGGGNIFFARDLKK